MSETLLLGRLVQRISAGGPLTVAEYMETALYDPEDGYYAAAARRSGRAGDFYTSVDTGPLFGAMIAVQLAEMWALLRDRGAESIDVVEAGAGDGRLTCDILDAAARDHPELYERARVVLVERSDVARARHARGLQAHSAKYLGSASTLPATVRGVIIANELLDAFPVHVIAGSPSGAREIYVAEHDGALVEIDGPLSSEIVEYLRRQPVALDDGVRVEIGVCAVRWIAEAAAALQAGFLLLFDYGLPAAALYSNAGETGTLTTYRRHTTALDSWLKNPGIADITTHVNLTAVADAAKASGLTSLGITDQTYFLLSLGMAEHVPVGIDSRAVAARLSAKTLLLPGGLGSTLKVLAFGKGVGRPLLRGFASARLT